MEWNPNAFHWNPPNSDQFISNDDPLLVYPSYNNTPHIALHPDQLFNNSQWQHQRQQPRSQSLLSPPSLDQSSNSSKNQFLDSENYDHESDEDQGIISETDGLDSSAFPKPKRKLTRSSRACTVCRKLKLRCVGAEDGRPCRKCTISHQQCIFPESKRGKSTKRTQEELSTTVRKLEQTLTTVIRSINDPALSSLVSGMASCPPSPKMRSTGAKYTPSSTSTSSHFNTSHERTTPAMPYLPIDTLNPLGLLAETSLAKTRMPSSEENTVSPTTSLESLSKERRSDDKQKVGIANEQYFKPGPMTLLPIRRLMIEHQIQPEMLSFVSTQEVVELFKIFFEHVNPHCCLLVPDLHTPSFVCARSPFLLTTICAIASRFSHTLTKHHRHLAKLAKHLAFDVPNKGYKSLEIVQAYLLLTLWGYGPACKYEHDTTWLLLGLAIRMGTDLNLHRQSPAVPCTTPEGVQAALDTRNRERTWILCFVLDRSISAQLGKPHTIQEDYIIRNVSQWWHHPVSVVLDAGLAAYAELQRILTRSLELMYSDTGSLSGLQTECNYLITIRSTENQIMALKEEWAIYTDNYCASRPDDLQLTYWKVSAKFYYHYALLVLNTFGLQDAVDRTPINLPHFLSRCHAAATACAQVIRDEMGPHGYLQYSPLSHFVQGSYAVLTLLKLTQPQFVAILDCREQAIKLASDVADLMYKLAVDSQHAPALYGIFLKDAVRAHTEDGTDDDTSDGNHSIVTPCTSDSNEVGKVATDYSSRPSSGPTTDQKISRSWDRKFIPPGQFVPSTLSDVTWNTQV